MPTWQRAYLVACAGVIGYALAYALCVFADWPKLTYLPYERSWALTAFVLAGLFFTWGLLVSG